MTAAESAGQVVQQVTAELAMLRTDLLRAADVTELPEDADARRVAVSVLLAQALAVTSAALPTLRLTGGALAGQQQAETTWRERVDSAVRSVSSAHLGELAAALGIDDDAVAWHQLVAIARDHAARTSSTVVGVHDLPRLGVDAQTLVKVREALRPLGESIIDAAPDTVVAWVADLVELARAGWPTDPQPAPVMVELDQLRALAMGLPRALRLDPNARWDADELIRRVRGAVAAADPTDVMGAAATELADALGHTTGGAWSHLLDNVRQLPEDVMRTARRELAQATGAETSDHPLGVPTWADLLADVRGLVTPPPAPMPTTDANLLVRRELAGALGHPADVVPGWSELLTEARERGERTGELHRQQQTADAAELATALGFIDPDDAPGWDSWSTLLDSVREAVAEVDRLESARAQAVDAVPRLLRDLRVALGHQVDDGEMLPAPALMTEVAQLRERAGGIDYAGQLAAVLELDGEGDVRPAWPALLRRVERLVGDDNRALALIAHDVNGALGAYGGLDTEAVQTDPAGQLRQLLGRVEQLRDRVHPDGPVPASAVEQLAHALGVADPRDGERWSSAAWSGLLDDVRQQVGSLVELEQQGAIILDPRRISSAELQRSGEPGVHPRIVLEIPDAEVAVRLYDALHPRTENGQRPARTDG